MVNDKIYDIKVTFTVEDDKSPITYAELRFIPVKYDYFITKYRMRPEDYPIVFPNVNDNRTYILKPLDGKFDELKEEFSVNITNITGGGEYRILIIARDEAGNERTFEYKTPYIRQYENIAKLDDTLIFAYYYPWYSPERHWKGGYKGTPLLGEYDSRDQIVISKHIDWATGHGIDGFIISWWGPNSWEDITLRDYILRNKMSSEIKFFILYESAGRLNLSANLEDQKQILLDDFNYLANVYFDNPNYFRINNKPAVILYLARIFKGDVYDTLEHLRKALRENNNQEVYLIGDLVYWQNPASDFEQQRIKIYDAVTAYNMHTSVKGILDDFERLVAQKYAQWLSVTKKLNVGFIPSALPGFDDSAVRSGNLPLPKSVERFEQQLKIASTYMDENLKMIIVTTFNEWHEFTNIEPSVEEEKSYLQIIPTTISKGTEEKYTTKVLIDASHDQYYVVDIGVNNLISKIKDELNWDVYINSYPLTYELLKDYDVVIVLNPQKELLQTEITSLKQYVENGGGLFIAGDWYKYAKVNDYNAITEGHGITFNDDTLLDNDQNDGKPYHPFVGIYNFNHPIMQFVAGNHKMRYDGQTLRVTGDAIWLIKAHDTSYSRDSNGNIIYPQKSNPVVAAATLAGYGRIVAYGSSSALSDSYGKYFSDNWPFIKGALLWLTKQG